jgi:hypothetical protein
MSDLEETCGNMAALQMGWGNLYSNDPALELGKARLWYWRSIRAIQAVANFSQDRFFPVDLRQT